MKTHLLVGMTTLCGLLAAGGCDAKRGATTVRGALHLPRAQAGRSFTVYVSPDGRVESAVAKASGTLKAGVVARYQIDNVPAGDFYVFALVDANGNGALRLDDVGDYLGAVGEGEETGERPNVTVPATGALERDIVVGTIGDPAWPEVIGTITLPASAEGKPYYVFVDDNEDPDDGFVDFDSGIVGAGTTIPYRIDNVEPTRGVTIYAWVDVNGDEDIDDGDLVGFYQGVGGRPPSGAGLDLPGAPPRSAGEEITADIEVAPVGFTAELTFTIPDAAPFAGKKWRLILDDDGTPENGTLQEWGGFVADDAQGSTDIKVSAGNAPEGSFIAYVFIDADDDKRVSKGDLFGYYSDSTGDFVRYIPGDSNLLPLKKSKPMMSLGEVKPIGQIVRGTVTLPAATANTWLAVQTSDRSNGELAGTKHRLLKEGETSVPYFVLPISSTAQWVSARVTSSASMLDSALVSSQVGWAGGSDGAAPRAPLAVTDGAIEAAITVVPVRNLISFTLSNPNSVATSGNSLLVLNDDPAAIDNAARYGVGYPEVKLFNVAAGTYFAHVWYDNNGNGSVDGGDARGFYQAPSPGTAPASGFSVAESTNQTDLSIVLASVP